MRFPRLESLLESPLRVVLLVGLLVGVPVIALGQLSDADARGRLATDEARVTVETAQRAADLIATQIVTTSAQLRAAAASDIGSAMDRGDVQALDVLLRQFEALMGVDVRRLFAVDRGGRVLASAPRDDRLTGSNVAAKDYFVALTDGPPTQFVESPVYRLDAANAQPGFTIAYPIRPARTTIGILVGEIDLQYLPSHLAAFRSSVEDLYVIDGSGQLVGQAAVAAVGRQNPDLYRQLGDDPAIRGLVVGRASDAPDPLGRGRRLLASALVRDTAWRVVAVRDSSLIEHETDAALLQLAILRIVLVALLLLGTYLLARVTRRVAAQRTALAESNERIADTNLQLARASQAKSQFLANMSHELRTPLNAIIGFADVLGQRMFGELNAKQADYVEDIVGSGRHLLTLINDILDLSKVEAGRMTIDPVTFSLRETLTNGVTMVRERAASHRIAVALDVAADVDLITADERKVRQVLLNLLTNAVKFTPDDGRITVSAARDDHEVRVAVADTGVGIAPDDQARVFEEFAQTKDGEHAAEGTGLGLTLSKRLVELQGGRIWVDSQVGKGSTFTFSLPLTVERPAS